MDLDDILVTDAELNVVDSGAWVAPDNAGDLELFVCGMGSKEVRKAAQAKQAAMRAKNRGKELTDEQNHKNGEELLFEVVLKNWRGLKQNGKDVPYSKEKAKELITSRNFKRFSELVFECASKIDADAKAFVEASTKN